MSATLNDSTISPWEEAGILKNYVPPARIKSVLRFFSISILKGRRIPATVTRKRIRGHP